MEVRACIQAASSYKYKINNMTTATLNITMGTMYCAYHLNSAQQKLHEHDIGRVLLKKMLFPSSLSVSLTSPSFESRASIFFAATSLKLDMTRGLF
mmetsp:Transcript_7581/g.12756  ORF Transcript_7581/g.12756 Transcript_7581/m.12756 type:complete len:96 (-) Transcript_7581:72-359(-)